MTHLKCTHLCMIMLVAASILFAFSGCSVDGEERSSNANLSSLTVSEGELSPEFSSDTTEYTVTVANDVTSITVTAVSDDETATMGAESGAEQTLAVGDNTITITVTAEDGTRRDYVIKVNREQSSNALLSSLTVSEGELSPAFNSYTTAYTVTVPNDVTSITVDLAAADEAASLSDESATFNDLEVGETQLSFIVTAEDGTEQYYTVTVTREQSIKVYSKVFSGILNTMMIDPEGILWAVGNNAQGQLGDGTTTDISTPKQIMTDVADVALGEHHSMILKTDGTLWATGYNAYGQLGDGTTTNRSTPIQVMTGVAQVSAGFGHTMILKTDDTLWGVGYNVHGEIGDGTTTNVSSPKQIMENVASVSCGYIHTMILKNDGTLWATGENYSGQLGDGTTTDRWSPLKVMEGVTEVSSGNEHTMILKTDNTLWATGYNGAGQLGNGTTEDVSTPEKFMEDVKAVSCGRLHTMILKTNGTLWATGHNEYGQLGYETEMGGYGIIKKELTPKQVTSDVASVSAGNLHSMFFKTDETLWATGNNEFGQLGDGTTTDVTIPIQVINEE